MKDLPFGDLLYKVGEWCLFTERGMCVYPPYEGGKGDVVSEGGVGVRVTR